MAQHELMIEIVGHVATAYQLPSNEPKEVTDTWVHQSICKPLATSPLHEPVDI
jgi:hypothetical protein